MKLDSCIWILEDDLGAQFIYEEVLGPRYVLRFFSDLHSFLSALRGVEPTLLPDLVIADIRLPDESFLEFLKSKQSMRQSLEVPFFVVSSLDEIDILRVCFKMGAVDYLTKPFKAVELVVKVERVLSKLIKKAKSSDDLHLDPTSLSLSKGKRASVSLTAKEFQIVALLKASENRIMSRSDLFSKVWGNLKVDPKSLDVHLVNLRRKLRQLDVEVRFKSPNLFCLEERSASKHALMN